MTSKSPSTMRAGGARRAACLVLLLACGIGVGNALASEPESLSPPRPISPAEKAAVSFALDYFEKGPAGWTKAISRESRFAGLSAGELEAEIEARAGPVANARWELLTIDAELKDRSALFSIEVPSGMETNLLLSLVEEGGRWKILDVRTQEEPAHVSIFDAELPPTKTPETPPPSRLGPALLLFGGIVLGAGAVVLLQRRPRVAMLLAAAGALAIFGAIGVAAARRQASPPKGTGPERRLGPDQRLASLRDPRRTLATSNVDSTRMVLASLPAAGAAGNVARLWRVEWALAERDLASAAEILNGFPAASIIPRVEILRGRLAFLRNRARDLATAYQNAMRLGPGNDALRLEAAQLSALMDDETQSDNYVEEAAFRGSRKADVSYFQAAYWIRKEKGVDAEKWFRQAWQLRPVERTELFPQAFFWGLLHRPELYAYLQLDSANEPSVKAANVSTSPVSMSPGVEARLCGGHLRLRSGTARLDVPGGASLAPAGTAVDDAGAWTRIEEREVLEKLPKLAALAASGTAILRPDLRREVATAIGALSRRHRWEDVIGLTEGAEGLIDRVPSEFVYFRAEALRRTGQAARARDLLVKASGSESFVRRSSPGSLFEIARLFSSLGEYDRGLEFAEKGSARIGGLLGKSLIQRIKMERKLDASSAQYASQHFLIRYPLGQPEGGARKLASVLEGERKRLQRWIPLATNSRTEVQLLWFDDFRVVVENAEVIGAFDGKIRLPFAGGQKLDFSHPEIVSIVTHELAHAMISELTADSAPRWLQEGLAQHVEMQREHFNPIPSYERHSRFLSLTTVDGALAGLSSADLTLAAYEESLWMLHFLEATSGIKSIQGLLASYRAGESTEDVLRKISYASVSDFEDRFRKWCNRPEAVSWKSPIMRYLGDKATEAGVPASLRLNQQRMRPAVLDQPFKLDQ